ncbi:phage distal tail protein [Streptomyces sp. NPDC048416]|uniref:phage distal tail protein n=1 Tax=Streptomyces sp. NPDC048416 TaxID=3365546 RepID=UPI00370F8968
MPPAQLTNTTEPPGSLITRDGQIQWAGLLFGPGTDYEIADGGLTGWADLPGLDSGDVLRPDQHGAWPGAQWAQARIITAPIWLLPDQRDQAAAVARRFRAATSVHVGEQWLAVRLHGETLACLARVSQRAIPHDRMYVTRGAAKATVQWVCADPRRFALAVQSVHTGLPSPETGLTWERPPAQKPDPNQPPPTPDHETRPGGGPVPGPSPLATAAGPAPTGPAPTDPAPAAPGLTWPLGWGTARSTGLVTAFNGGDASANPVIEFRGPVSGPSLTRLSDGLRLEYDIVLAASDVLTVDTGAGTVLLNGTTSRIHTASVWSTPEQLFQLEPGQNTLSFRCASGTGAPAADQPQPSATVTWRDANW